MFTHTHTQASNDCTSHALVNVNARMVERCAFVNCISAAMKCRFTCRHYRLYVCVCVFSSLLGKGTYAFATQNSQKRKTNSIVPYEKKKGKAML